MPSQSFCFDVTRRPVLAVHIGAPGSVRALRGRREPVAALHRALIDTGATRSAVTSELAGKLGLAVRGQQHMRSATEVRLVNAYVVDVAFSLAGDLVLLEAATILEITGDLGSIDLLLGWDILDQFILTLDGPARRFTLESSWPPTKLS